MSKSFLTPIKLAIIASDPTGSKGSLYYNNATNSIKYYDGTTWVTLAATGSSGIIFNENTTPPSSPNIGDIWVDTADGTEYTYVSDENGNQWVELSNAGLPGPAGSVNSLSIGTVISGLSASATISGSAPNQILNLVLPQGTAGISGVNGAQGIQGLTGFGTQGIQGTTGAQGTQGLIGSGTQGTTGAQGTQGVQGLLGIQGLQGLQGGGFNQAQGTQGTQGLIGSSIQGTQGLIGSGTQGTTGAQGIQGLIGSGTQGTQGLIGSGTQGTTGTQGTQGLIGSSIQGTQGIQGGGFNQAQGTQGLIGSGTQGTQGIQGAILTTISGGTQSTSTSGPGYMGMPQNLQTANYGIVASDAGKHIYITTTGTTVTIPANSSVSLYPGFTFTVINAGGVTTTVAITTDTMYLANAGTTGNRTLAPYGMATAVKVASAQWIISGNGLT